MLDRVTVAGNSACRHTGLTGSGLISGGIGGIAHVRAGGLEIVFDSTRAGDADIWPAVRSVHAPWSDPSV